MTDVEVLVVGPQDLARLELASSASRHPSRLEAPPELTALTGGGSRYRRLFRRN